MQLVLEKDVKYEEKQRRKKLKRRIWASAACLALIGGMALWSIGDRNSVEYYWRSSNSPSNATLISRDVIMVNGGIVIQDAHFSNITISPKYYAAYPGEFSHFTDNNGIHTSSELCVLQYPRIYENVVPGTYVGAHFAGFEFFYSSRHLKNPVYEYDVTHRAFVFPMWVPALPPLVMMILWILKLRRSSRKPTAFPVSVVQKVGIPDKN